MYIPGIRVEFWFVCVCGCLAFILFVIEVIVCSAIRLCVIRMAPSHYVHCTHLTPLWLGSV